MKMHRGTAAAQIRRLSGLPFWATLKHEAVDELVTILMTYSASSDHANKAISTILQEPARDRVPTPSELIKYIAATRPAEEPTQRFTGCQQCKGTGFVEAPTVWREFCGIKYPYNGVRLCQCRPKPSN